MLCALQPIPLNPPRLVHGHSTITVRRLLDVHHWGQGLQHLVDWEGYGPEERSWIPRSFIVGPGLVREFHRTQPGKLLLLSTAKLHLLSATK